MKKVIGGFIVLLFLGIVVYQNGSSWLLWILTFNQGKGPNIPAGATSSLAPPYKDGTYTGDVANAFYGNVQVQTVIVGSKISSVVFLQHPNDATRSIAINTIAMPELTQEAIQAQNASVNVVSGATDTSIAFNQSLASALARAK